jgi:hypothetical protein
MTHAAVPRRRAGLLPTSPRGRQPQAFNTGCIGRVGRCPVARRPLRRPLPASPGVGVPVASNFPHLNLHGQEHPFAWAFNGAFAARSRICAGPAPDHRPP